MRILAFDPSKTCGAALVDDGILRHSWLILAPEGNNGLIYRFFLNSIKNIIMWNIPDLIVQESYFVGKFHNGADVNYVLRGLIELAAADSGRPLRYVTPTEWKKHVAGRSTPSVEQKKLWGAKANKQFIIKALEEDFGISLPDYIDSKGKAKKPTSDCWDAIGIALCAANFKGKILSTVEEIGVSYGR